MCLMNIGNAAVKYIHKIACENLTDKYKHGIFIFAVVMFSVRKYADVAQLAEQLICNQQVIGSSPIIGFLIFGPLAQSVRATGS